MLSLGLEQQIKEGLIKPAKANLKLSHHRDARPYFLFELLAVLASPDQHGTSDEEDHPITTPKRAAILQRFSRRMPNDSPMIRIGSYRVK